MRRGGSDMAKGSARHRAAIVVLRVVGYSRLMEAKEAVTLATLAQLRESAVEPSVRSHGGRIVKWMGDGALVQFDSAVNAVWTALEMQREFAGANVDLPQDRRIPLRMGIHLGDLMTEDFDIYGEGVSIASRLEALAQPGGICLSEETYSQVRGRVQLSVSDLGLVRLKDVSMPVR